MVVVVGEEEVSRCVCVCVCKREKERGNGGVQGERDGRKTWGLSRYSGSRRARVQEDIRYSSGDGERGEDVGILEGVENIFFFGVLVEHTGASPPPLPGLASHMKGE